MNAGGATTQHTRGGSTTVTGQPLFTPAAVGSNPQLAALIDMLMARAQTPVAAAAPRAVAPSLGRAPMAAMPRLAAPRREVLTGQDPADAAARRIALQDMMAGSQALSQPEPRGMTTVAQSASSGRTLDAPWTHAEQRRGVQ